MVSCPNLNLIALALAPNVQGHKYLIYMVGLSTHGLGYMMYGLYDIFSLISYMISFVDIVM